MFSTVLTRYDPTNAPRIPWHLSRRYSEGFDSRPIAVVPRPVPALVVEANGVRVEASESGLDRILRFLGQTIREVAPYALGAYLVHRVCETVENSSKE